MHSNIKNQFIIFGIFTLTFLIHKLQAAQIPLDYQNRNIEQNEQNPRSDFSETDAKSSESAWTLVNLVYSGLSNVWSQESESSANTIEFSPSDELKSSYEGESCSSANVKNSDEDVLCNPDTNIIIGQDEENGYGMKSRYGELKLHITSGGLKSKKLNIPDDDEL